MQQLRFPLDISIEPALGEPVQSNPDLSSLAQRVGTLLEDDIKYNPLSWRGLDVNVNVNVGRRRLDVGSLSLLTRPVKGARRTERRASTYRVEVHSRSLISKDQSTMWLTNRSLHIRDNSSSHDSGMS